MMKAITQSKYLIHFTILSLGRCWCCQVIIYMLDQT